MKVASSSSARSSKFGPYKAPLAPRPSTMTFKYGARLRAARDFAALDAWLAENLSPDALLLPKGVLGSQDALCVVFMSVFKGADDGVFRNHDTYSLSLHVEVEECAASPLIFLARFVGSNEDGDAPLWTRILEPRKQQYFLEPRTFAAMLVQSIPSRSISARMCDWARTTSKPKMDLLIPRVRSSKLIRRVTTSPIRKMLNAHSPPASPTSSKRKRTDDGAREDSKRQKIGGVDFKAEKENIDPRYHLRWTPISRFAGISLSSLSTLSVCPWIPARSSYKQAGLDNGLVKKWLLLQAYGAEGSNDALHGSHGDTVLCTVTRSYFKPARLHALAITATVSVDISSCLHARTSPSAVLDTFAGDCNDATAPGWLRWLDISVVFPHDRAGFIGLFVNLAMWAESLETKRTIATNYKPVRPCAKHDIYSTRESLAFYDGSPTCIMDITYEDEDAETDSDGGSPAASWDDEHASYALEPLPALRPLDQVSGHRWPEISIRARDHGHAWFAFSPFSSSPLPALDIYMHNGVCARRRSAITPPFAASAAAPPPFAAPEPLPEITNSFLQQYIPADPLPADTFSFAVAAEAAGLSHLQQVEASGEAFIQISVDDWELQNPTEDNPSEESADGPAPLVDDNEPDPFYIAPRAAQPLPTARDVHPNRAVYIIYVAAAGAPINPPMRTTLRTVINHLGAEPAIQILPVCPGCLEVFAASTSVDALCSRCSHPLFPNNPTPSQIRNNTTPENPRPYLQFPTKSLAEQLETLLSVEGMEEEIEKSTGKAKAPIPGVWKNIFDGKVCQELPTADGGRFFFPSDEEVAVGELRIGVTMGVDWFSYLRSQISASHTSCPMSYSLINLPEHLRYRTANLLLAGIMPGPKEANPDQCQRFLRPLINELLRFPARTNTEHRRLQKEYLRCTTKSARDAFVKQNAARWSELHRLPYFNLCVVKTHLYHIWVQLNVLRKTKELRSLHALLAKLKLLAHLGRLPSLIGEPAGGSLTADQWLVFCTIVAPLINIFRKSRRRSWPSGVPGKLPQFWRPNVRRLRQRAKKRSSLINDKAQAPAGKRVRRPTARAAEMDIDPDDAAGVDAGANDDSDDDSYGLNPTQQKKRKRQQQQARQSTCLLSSTMFADTPHSYTSLDIDVNSLSKYIKKSQHFQMGSPHSSGLRHYCILFVRPAECAIHSLSFRPSLLLCSRYEPSETTTMPNRKLNDNFAFDVKLRDAAAITSVENSTEREDRRKQDTHARRLSRSVLSDEHQNHRADIACRANHRDSINNTRRIDSSAPWWERVAILNTSQTAKPLGLLWNRNCKICGIKVLH
ncbi:hypothetical protein B0H13DRAFT_1873214 [Mycena leptocephala]|nr:hypothetical protein B0H13DRAFT_1873214 [Mycena leptocephala]